MMDILRELNEQGGKEQQMWKIVQRMLGMEGIEDVREEKLQNDQKEWLGRWIAVDSIAWNNLLGMNVPEEE
ncbi:hypothetical protein BLNAU_8698 [Blattamonas nauphoetae]|uniref:DUF4351 domain-containing protein n=1 Tax=Blattamonas nauphoetae TaxID=2049346 RepID=A0ABQ9XXY8_9EUKA|nr:hypothetical protein BLNAU_8698 [Blattamonas nauphoetae]